MRGALVLVFLIINTISGFKLLFATPMGQVPDEPAHIARAAALLHGQILGTRRIFDHKKVSGVLVNVGLVRAANAELHSPQQPKLTRAARKAAWNIPWSKDDMFDVSSNTVEYLPCFYIPASLGIGIGKLVGLSPMGALYLGRAFMLSAFLLAGAAALWLARFGVGVLFIALSLPMTLALAASLSQDGAIIGASALAGALLTRDDDLHPKARWIAAGIIALIICSKPPYGLLLFCTALPIGLAGTLRRMAASGLFGLPAVAWVLTMMRTSFVIRNLPPYHPGKLWPGDRSVVFHTIAAHANLRVLAHAPILVVKLPYDVLSNYFGLLKTEFIGRLGWLDVALPNQIYLAWTFALLSAVIGACLIAEPGGRRWRPMDAIFVGLILLATIIAISLSLYLSWTPVGATMIQGIQGRYFIPLVPFLPLILPRFSESGRTSWLVGLRALPLLEVVSMIPAIALAAVNIDMLPALVHARFG